LGASRGQRFFTRLFNSVARREQEERLREEIAEHIALQTDENRRAGLSPAEARRQAMLKFGSVKCPQPEGEVHSTRENDRQAAP
jgi:hypothetical protein